MCGDNGLKVYHAASALLLLVVVVQTHFWAFRESGISELHNEEIQHQISEYLSETYAPSIKREKSQKRLSCSTL